MKKLAIVFCGIVAAAGIGLSGCESGGNTDVLNMGVINVTAETVYGSANPNPADGAANVRVSVSGPGMNTVEETFSMVSRSAKLPSFPEGYDRQVMFEYLGIPDAVSGEAKIIGRGRSASLDVWQGDMNRPVKVFVAPVNSMVKPVKLNDNGDPVQSVPANRNRVGATATELDDGRILICGGATVKASSATWYKPSDLDEVTATCEFYQPSTGEFTAAGSMSVPRAFHQAIKLGSPENPDGRVVLISGYTQAAGGSPTQTPTVEIFNPDNGTFTQTASKIPAGRALFTADLVSPDQNFIVLMGGLCSAKQAGGTWDMIAVTGGGDIRLIEHRATYPGDASLQTATGTVRFNHSMVRVSGFAASLDPKKKGYDAYLVIGGENESGIVDSVEVFLILQSGGKVVLQRYDDLRKPIQGGGRTLAPAVYVKEHGIVWIVGGFTKAGLTDPTDRIDAFRVNEASFKNEFLKLSGARGAVTAAKIAGKEFLISGGIAGTDRIGTAEVLGEGPYVKDGKTYQIPTIKPGVPAMDSPRAGHLAITDQTGRVLIVGGVSQTNQSPDPIMYNPID